MKPAFAVENLSYAFGTQSVLKDLSFSVPQSDVFIIIGPNGAGKTTLIKLMVGILKIQTGQIEILQAPIGKYSQKKLAKALAYVPQGLPVGFPFTVEETVLLGRAPHQKVLGLASQNDLDIAQQAMAFTEVAHLARRKLDQLSGGEQQPARPDEAPAPETAQPAAPSDAQSAPEPTGSEAMATAAGDDAAAARQAP